MDTNPSPDQVRESIVSESPVPVLTRGPALTQAEVERRFTFHRPEGQKVEQHNDVRALFKRLAFELIEILPGPSREASLAFTHLEEAANWAHAAIARDGK